MTNGQYEALQPLHGLTRPELDRLAARLRGDFAAVMAAHRVTARDDLFADIYLPLAAALARAASRRPGPLVVGVNGAQGSGKTTLCALLGRLLESGFGLRSCVFSIDDLYLTRAERLALGRAVHPLLTTRGVPGTHDVALGLRLLADLRDRSPGRCVAVPVFDKANDDRTPRTSWQFVTSPVDLILFEGWCVGTAAQDDADLGTPINTLERDEDPVGTWRRYVNERLRGDYAQLFAQLDLLIMLAVPGMASVREWRTLQERRLAERLGARSETGRIMDEAALTRFIMHYERLTRHTLAEMPQRADLVLPIGPEHQPDGILCRPGLAEKFREGA